MDVEMEPARRSQRRRRSLEPSDEPVSKRKKIHKDSASTEDIYLQRNFNMATFTGTSLETIYESPKSRGTGSSMMGMVKLKRQVKFTPFQPSKVKIKRRKDKTKKLKRLSNKKRTLKFVPEENEGFLELPSLEILNNNVVDMSRNVLTNENNLLNAISNVCLEDKENMKEKKIRRRTKQYQFSALPLLSTLEDDEEKLPVVMCLQEMVHQTSEDTNVNMVDIIKDISPQSSPVTPENTSDYRSQNTNEYNESASPEALITEKNHPNREGEQYAPNNIEKLVSRLSPEFCELSISPIIQKYRKQRRRSARLSIDHSIVNLGSMWSEN